MPEYDDDGNEIPESRSEGQNLRSQLEATLAENKRLAAEMDTAVADRKELAFLRADIGDSKAVNYFKSHYDGPMDAEAIRAAATEAGVIVENQAAQEALVGQAQMSAVAAGSMVPPPPGNNEEMWAEYERVLVTGTKAGSNTVMQDALGVLQRYGYDGSGMEGPPQMSRSGQVPQTVPINSPEYRGTPIE